MTMTANTKIMKNKVKTTIILMYSASKEKKAMKGKAEESQ